MDIFSISAQGEQDTVAQVGRLAQMLHRQPQPVGNRLFAGGDDEQVVVNLQGDEPAMPPSLLEQCAEFIYGGCGGNANRFASALACIDACGGNAPELSNVKRVSAPDAFWMTNS